MTTAKRGHACSTSGSASNSAGESSALADSEIELWFERGRRYARKLLERGLKGRDILTSVLGQFPSSAVDLGEALMAFMEPTRAQERLEIRRAFLGGVLDVAVQAGGLAFGLASEEDVELGFARPQATADDHRRCN